MGAIGGQAGGGTLKAVAGKAAAIFEDVWRWIDGRRRSAEDGLHAVRLSGKFWEEFRSGNFSGQRRNPLSEVKLADGNKVYKTI